jgi:hypothetical protein
MGCGASTAVRYTVDRPTVEALRAKYADENTPAAEDLDAAAPGGTFLRSGHSLKRIMAANSVLVQVRVRPLNSRELSASAKECITIESSSQLSIEGRRFAFDASFRSDATNAEVYARSGRMVLGKVLDGFNGCVFAYGQTGSGKTYTMQGTVSDPGVIPQLCTELFGRIGGLAGAKEVGVRLSMCEIYNEKLHDLLHDRANVDTGKPQATPRHVDLSIKEDPSPGGRGIFVDGLSESVAASSEALLQLIAEGQARRAVGRTNMNEHSSRSHAVVTLRVDTCAAGDADRMTATSAKLHLVDLAGSERQKGTGATGERLKEGAQINLSLTALGHVISALSEKKRGHVPYRDSKLTRLLQDSLGGNSVTVMLCNASPADASAEETLSALRFAERAKKIENVAIVNRDPRAAKAAALYVENKRLRERVAALDAHVKELEQHY